MALATGGAEQLALPMLEKDEASLVLAPAGERSVNVDVFVNGREHVPRIFDRVTFGQFNSPVIRVREMY